MEIKRFKKGEIIFREGESAECMYEIQSGSVGIYAQYGSADKKLLTRLERGKYFGEMAMIEKTERSATAVALSAGTALRVITWQTLGEYFREQPGKVVMMMQDMGSRIRELTQDYMGACRAITEMAERAEAEKKEQESAWIQSNMRRYLDSYRAYVAYQDY